MDFRYAELCSFDPMQNIITSHFKVVDPFRITLLKDQMCINIEAKEDIEWISNTEGSCIIRAGCSKLIQLANDKVKGSFRVLKDETRQIFEHEWTIMR